MESDMLNSIIGDQTSDDSQLVEAEKPKKEKVIDNTTVYCDEPGCNEYFSGAMAKAQLGRHKSAMHDIHKSEKVTSPKEEHKIKDMVPENLAYLRAVLKSFSAKNTENIINGMLDNPESIDELRDLLVASGTDTKAHPLILRRYATYIGQPLTENSTAISTSAPTGAKAKYRQYLEDRAEEAYIILMEQKASGNQNKDTGEISKLTQAMADMQRQFNDKLAEMQRQNAEQLRAFTESKKEDEYRRTIELLKEEIKSVRENSGSQISQVADSMKQFAMEITHSFEKKEILDKHERETTELKKEIAAAQNNKPLQEKMLDKTEALANNVAAGLGAMTAKGMSSQETLERANSALALAQAGYTPQQAESILNPPQQRRVPSAKEEYENLQKTTEILNQLDQESKVPRSEAPAAEAPKPADYSQHVKFNTEGS